MKMHELLREAEEGLPPTIKPLQIPQFPEVPQQDGELGDGSTAGTDKKTGGKYLKGGQGTFVWDKQGQPSMWIAPNFAGMTQRYDMKTGDINVRYQNGPLDVSGVYDKTGKRKDGQGSMGYDMGVASVRKGPQGSTMTVRGGAKDGSQDQTVAVN
jgi:hypothetical protein